MSSIQIRLLALAAITLMLTLATKNWVWGVSILIIIGLIAVIAKNSNR